MELFLKKHGSYLALILTHSAAHSPTFCKYLTKCAVTFAQKSNKLIWYLEANLTFIMYA